MKTQTIDTVRLKQSVDLRTIAERYTVLRRQSDAESAGACPWCGGTDRFRVFVDHFFCRPGPGHCGRKGDTIEFIQQRANVDFKTACEMLAGGILPTTSTPVQPSKQTPQSKAAEFDESYWLVQIQKENEALISNPGKFAQLSRDYLISRGFTAETIEAFKLGYNAGKKVPGFEEKGIAISLPWFDRESHLVSVKYRFVESHKYKTVDKNGVEKETRYTSAGSPKGRLFGWQAVKGPSRNRIVIICEGEVNALSLWQAGNGKVDVLSSGSETGLRGPLPDDAVSFVQQYEWRIVWADEAEVADSVAQRINAHFSMPSPNKQDANKILQSGKLEKLLTAMLKKIGATVDAPSPSALPVEDGPADYVYDEPEVVQPGLTWPDAERLHAELKATVPSQRIYGIGADPAQPGAWRIVKRNY